MNMKQAVQTRILNMKGLPLRIIAGTHDRWIKDRPTDGPVEY